MKIQEFGKGRLLITIEGDLKAVDKLYKIIRKLAKEYPSNECVRKRNETKQRLKTESDKSSHEEFSESFKGKICKCGAPATLSSGGEFTCKLCFDADIVRIENGAIRV